MNDEAEGKPSSAKSGEAAQVNSNEAAILTNAAMKDGEIERLIAAFEGTAHFDEEGKEFWFARDLQRLLEYERWENFLSAIRRAETACERSGQVVRDHFRETTKMIELGKGAVRTIDDFCLTRYACYLVTQNGDAKKKPVAFGQTYFAIQTRRQELSDQATTVPITEDEKRIFLRNQIKEHNIKLSSAAKDAGVVTPQEFAIFHSKGYQGLYGRTVPEIRQYKGLPASADILDRMGSTELAANFFRVTQTEEKLRKDAIRERNGAYSTHYAVGRQVREAMLKISGIAPEDLPAADSIKSAERRIRNDVAKIPAGNKNARVAHQTTAALEECQAEDRPIDLLKDLWKFALLIMALRPDGEVSMAELIGTLPAYIFQDSHATSQKRNDDEFSQLVHDLKSSKTAKSNFIYQGYAEDVPDGFRITAKGREFVKSYFSS